jgi:tetratricopeptide (TPR) repeat protein
MKKVILIASVLFVAVISTACINNLAVQDLNNKAKVYADKGDYTQAIERLKSSIDLDPSIFETHYNLAVVYTRAEDYVNAVDEYKKVISMKPNMADSYYSLATAQNNLAVDMKQGKVQLNVDGSLASQKEDVFEDKITLTDNEEDYIEDLYEESLENYKKYLELNPNASDKADVEAQVEKIENILNPESESNKD